MCHKLAQACPSVIQVSRTSNIPPCVLTVLTKLLCRRSTNCFVQSNRRYSQTLWEVSYTAVRMPPLLKYRHSKFAHANINSTILKVALRVSCLGIAFPNLPAGRIQLVSDSQRRFVRCPTQAVTSPTKEEPRLKTYEAGRERVHGCATGLFDAINISLS